MVLRLAIRVGQVEMIPRRCAQRAEGIELEPEGRPLDCDLQ